MLNCTVLLSFRAFFTFVASVVVINGDDVVITDVAVDQAGIRGYIGSHLGDIPFLSGKGHPCRMKVYSMFITQKYDVWSEGHRKRRFVSGCVDVCLTIC